MKSRIALVKDAFNKRKELLTKGLSKKLKKRMVKILIRLIVLYGCETWALMEEYLQIEGTQSVVMERDRKDKLER